MLQFKNISGTPLSVYKPVGDPDALLVDPGQTVSVAAELAAEQPHDDAWVVGDGDRAAAWPKALWELVQDKPRPQTRGLVDSDKE